MSTKITTEERDKARDDLRELFPKGSTATTLLRHVSQSGMQREVDVVAVVDGQPQSVAWLVRRATGERIGKRGGIVIRGAGMDMGFALIYDLSSTLYGDGYSISQRWL